MSIFYFSREPVSISNYTPKHLAGFKSRSSNETLGPPDIFCRMLHVPQKLMILSIDVLYISDSIYEFCCDLIGKKLGLQQVSVYVCATHTHSAPNISSLRFGEYDEIFEKNLKDSISRCIDRLKDSEAFKLEQYFESQQLNNIMVYRRKIGRDVKSFFIKKRMLLLPNDYEEIDKTLKLLKFVNSKGERGILEGLSCHPTFSSSQEVSADFPGEVSNILEKRGISNYLFLQGWSADVRPKSTGNFASAKGITGKLKAIVNKNIFVPSTGSFFSFFCQSLVSETFNSKNSLSNEIANIRCDQRSFVLSSKTGRTEKRFNVGLVNISNVIMVMIPAEVSTKYFSFINFKLPNHFLFPVGCANGMIGYIPYPDQCQNYGYEVLSFSNYDWDSPLSITGLVEFRDGLLDFIQGFLHVE